MKAIRRTNKEGYLYTSAAYYRLGLITYGVIDLNTKDEQRRYYQLDFGAGMFFRKLYKGSKKPWLKNLILLNLLVIIPALIAAIAFGLVLSIVLLFEFWNIVLLQQSFITKKSQVIMGVLWLMLAVYGAANILYTLLF